MASSVPGAKAALKTLLEAIAWPADADPEIAVSVRWGGPTEGDDIPGRTDLVFFGDTEINDETRVLGAARHDEHFRINVVIQVRRYGDDEQTTETRAWALYDALVPVVRANPTLSGTVNRLDHEQVMRVLQMNGPTAPQTWLSQITVGVPYVALITG